MFRKNKGFTLIETLAALMISAMLLGALSSVGLAFIQVSREGEVVNRLQRELVFSFEAIEKEMRIAQNVFGGNGNWTIQQIDVSSGEYVTRNVTLSHDEASSTLTLGNRVLSRNVKLFAVSGTGNRWVISMGSVSSIPMVKSTNLPLLLTDEVFLRNYGFVPPGQQPEEPEEPEDPDDPPQLVEVKIIPVPLSGSDLMGPEVGQGQGKHIPSVNLSCATFEDQAATTPVATTCRLQWSIVGTTEGLEVEWDGVSETHTWTIGPFQNNDIINVTITAKIPGQDQPEYSIQATYAIKKQ